MELERKTFSGCEVKVLDESKGIMEAIVSVFNNTDLGGDIVRPGFFDKASSRKLPKGVWAHDPTQIIAKTLATYPLLPGDQKLPEKIRHLGGQYVKAQFNLETQRGREAFSDLKGGYVDEFSFGYYVAPGGAHYMDNGNRELMSAEGWPEWSPVLEGMNPATALISAKSADAAHLDGQPFAEQLDAALDAAKDAQAHTLAALTRAHEIKAIREGEQKIGRAISAARAGKLQEMSTQLRATLEAMDALLDEALGEPEETEPAEDAGKSAADVQALKLRIVQSMAALRGAPTTR